MEEPKAPEAPPATAPAKGRGMWIGVVVVAIVIVILLAAVFGGLLGTPPTTADHVEVTTDAVQPQPAGIGFNITVRILTTSGVVVTDYTGNVTFSSTDANASLPAVYTFVAADAGSHSFALTLRTAGVQTVTVNATKVNTPTKNASVSVAPNANVALWVIGIASGNGQSGANGTVLSPLVVRVTDGYGNPLNGAHVNYTLNEPAGMTGGWLSNNSTATGSAGLASTTMTLGTGNGVGTYSVDAWLEARPSTTATFTATKTA